MSQMWPDRPLAVTWGGGCPPNYAPNVLRPPEQSHLTDDRDYITNETDTKRFSSSVETSEVSTAGLSDGLTVSSVSDESLKLHVDWSQIVLCPYCSTSSRCPEVVCCMGRLCADCQLFGPQEAANEAAVGHPIFDVVDLPRPQLATTLTLM